MIRLRDLFGIFFKIGAFTLGGGYAMLSMVEMEIVNKKKYVEKNEFWDLIAVVQTLPGVFAINTALYVGYKLRGYKGALSAAIGATLPSFVAILLIAACFREIKDNIIVERIFRGIRPCVVALIFIPAVRLFIHMEKKWLTVWIPFAAAIAIWWFKISPILIIVLTVIIAIVCEIYSFHKIKNTKE